MSPEISTHFNAPFNRSAILFTLEFGLNNFIFITAILLSFLTTLVVIFFEKMQSVGRDRLLFIHLFL